MEKTLVLIKPDAVERNLIGKILNEYEKNDLKVIDLKLMVVPKDIARKHYAEHEGKPFFDNLISYITRGPLVALVLEGENAVKKARTLNGKTDPKFSEKNTIRALYGKSLSENSVHSSDSKESAKREIDLWFNG